jgi:hypothetical protein
MMRSRNRKKQFVSKAIQGRILWRFCLYWILYHFCLFVVLGMNALLSPKPPSTFSELLATLWNQHFWTFALVMAVFPIVFRDILKTTHRIAGPLVRFEQALKQMTQGEPLEPIKLRKKDLLLEFRDVFNEFVESRNRELETVASAVSHQKDAEYSTEGAVANHV